MVEQEHELDLIFRALADPTRRAMLRSLKIGGSSISELAAPHAMSLAGASKHVGVLERAGLVSRERRGREHCCTLNAESLRRAESWLQSCADLWNARFDRLDELLKGEESDE